MQENIKLFVPGRLCLFGEHSDWASEYRKENNEIEKGYTIVATINQGIYATCKKSNQFIFEFNSKKIVSDIDSKSLKNQIYDDEFFSCVLSTTIYMIEHYSVSGVEINIDHMDLPMGVGLSSSSSVCVLVVKAFSELYQLNLTDDQIMNIAYVAERNADFQCGRMDHVCALNKKLVLMTFDQEKVQIEEVNTNQKLFFVFCEIKKKNTRKILAQLNSAYPYSSNESQKQIQEAFGIKNKEIVLEAISYIEKGNIVELGNLMIRSQTLFDEVVSPYLDCEFEEKQLHKIIQHQEISKLILGAKGVGSHGDGAVQFLVENKEKQEQLVKTLHNLGYNAYKLEI